MPNQNHGRCGSDPSIHHRSLHQQRQEFTLLPTSTAPLNGHGQSSSPKGILFSVQESFSKPIFHADGFHDLLGGSKPRKKTLLTTINHYSMGKSPRNCHGSHKAPGHKNPAKKSRPGWHRGFSSATPKTLRLKKQRLGVYTYNVYVYIYIYIYTYVYYHIITCAYIYIYKYLYI